ncbi:hypothetical protein [Sulfurimonas sp.]|uniref:hypothetical protein n=1 Tax=Sulfurimonas sp. TaxID=2022749 RepID=UPI002AB2E81E|nr:hypothetical protein [Sulfurimonas sp.]
MSINKEFLAYMDIHECNGQYETCLEVLHISLVINKKKYMKVKSEIIYSVDMLDLHNNKYIYERNFIKYRHAKKAYKKMMRGILT